MNFIPKIEYTDILDGLPKSFTFDSPPEGDPFGEEVKANIRVSKSNNGRKQVQFNYLEEVFKLQFIFQSEATKQAFDDFFKRHASRGAKFNYFPSSDELDFNEYTLADRSASYARPIPAATLGEFEYDFSFTIERIINVV